MSVTRLAVIVGSSYAACSQYKRLILSVKLARILPDDEYRLF
jgi:hypothetical protein